MIPLLAGHVVSSILEQLCMLCIGGEAINWNQHRCFPLYGEQQMDWLKLCWTCTLKTTYDLNMLNKRERLAAWNTSLCQLQRQLCLMHWAVIALKACAWQIGRKHRSAWQTSALGVGVAAPNANHDAKERTSEVRQINRFPHWINRFFGILIASLCVGFPY